MILVLYLLCKYKKVIIVYSVLYTKVLVVGKLNIRMTQRDFGHIVNHKGGTMWS